MTDSNITALLAMQDLNILVTDSGLGGLSVAAGLDAKFSELHPFKKVTIRFVNALPSETYFYNRMPNTAEKVRVFNAALQGMYSHYNPDLILIACNTLSVIYDQTPFSKNADIPVVGVVDFGVRMLQEEIQQTSGGRIVILGTPTTIGQDSHRQKLINLGVDSSNIATVACPMLESEIQTDPASDVVRLSIEMYAEEALAKWNRPGDGPLAVGLCCTHYQYAQSVFRDVFAEQYPAAVHIVDPNQGMIEFLFKEGDNNRFTNTSVQTEVISQAKINDQDLQSIGRLLAQTSPDFAARLANYQWKKDLFSW